MVYAQTRMYPGKQDAQIALEFFDTNGSLNVGQTTRPSNNQQEKRNCQNVDFVVPVDHCVKLKENEKISTWTLLGK